MPDDPHNRGDFTTLYQATIAPLRRYLARLLGNVPEAQDVAHDAYLRVYPAVSKHEAERPEALLYVTARRLAINRIKRRSISPFLPGEPGLEQAALACARCRPPGDGAPGAAHAGTGDRRASPGCRAVLLLCKVDLLSHREVADRLGISVSTVEKQHARALRLLRAALHAEHSTGAFPTGATPGPEAAP